MNKEIRQVSEDGKVISVTCFDERWYVQTETDDDGNVLSVTEYPSVTWIASSYPKGIGFSKWLASHGWDEAKAIKEAAGRSGYKVHQGISDMLLGNTIDINGMLTNPDTGEQETITLDEYESLMSFAEWFEKARPTPLENEIAVFNDEHRYAGTADFICEIDGERWLIDFKTSQNVWPSYEIQLAAYKHALEGIDRMAILQIGYKRNKNRYKFTEVEDQFDLFLATKRIWEKESGSVQPSKKDYPVSLSLHGLSHK